MLSNFSWLQYGIFIGIFLLIYFGVVLVVYFRKEIRHLYSSVSRNLSLGDSKITEGAVSEDLDLLGKGANEEGHSRLSVDELDFGSNDELLQGEMADCLEELDETFSLVAEKEWDRKKFFSVISEIAKIYSTVFQSPLRGQVLAHISSECADKLNWQIPVSELESIFSKQAPNWTRALAIGLLSFSAQAAVAQDGNQGIAEATSKVAGYFDTGTDLMYAIGAITGLVGAVKVYSKWNAGEPDTAKVATAWFGSCIFLVVVATVLKSFFGI